MSTAAIPCREPAQFAAGDSLSWTKSLLNYLPTDGWSLLYSFRGNGSILDVQSTVSLSNHLVSLAADKTAAMVAGIYAVAGYAVKGAQRVQIYDGQIKVTPNLQTADGSFDPRTQNRRTLDNINAVIEGRASSTILRSTVEGTVLERIPFKDLLDLQAIYQVKVRNEEIDLQVAQGRGNGRTIRLAFTKPK